MRLLALVLLTACELEAPRVQHQWECVAETECGGKYWTIDTDKPICRAEEEDAITYLDEQTRRALATACDAVGEIVIACERGRVCVNL